MCLVPPGTALILPARATGPQTALPGPAPRGWTFREAVPTMGKRAPSRGTDLRRNSQPVTGVVGGSRPSPEPRQTPFAPGAPVRRAPLTSLLALLLMLPLAACGGGPGGDEDGGEAKASAEADSSEAEEAIPVEVAVLQRGPLASVLKSSTNLEAEEAVTVFAEASRRVRQILVEEGDRVNRGQLLLRLQDDEQRSNVAKAAARLDQSRREYERQQKLQEQGLTTEKAFNDALSQYEQDRLALEDAERQLGYTEVRATIGGTVTQRMVNVGDQVNVGSELFALVDFESLVARVYVPEKNLGELEPGLPARLHARAISPEPYAGEVLRVSPVVDPRTGTVKVTVAVGGQPGLRPGLFVDVELVTAVHNTAVRLPKRALVYEGDATYAFVVRDGRAQRVGVQPVLADAQWVEPAAGLDAGDSVVVAGQAALKQGVLVEIYDRASEGGATASSGDSAVADAGQP